MQMNRSKVVLAQTGSEQAATRGSNQNNGAAAARTVRRLALGLLQRRQARLKLVIIISWHHQRPPGNAGVSKEKGQSSIGAGFALQQRATGAVQVCHNGWAAGLG